MDQDFFTFLRDAQRRIVIQTAGAKVVREVYDALRTEGFDDEQAMRIIEITFSGTIQSIDKIADAAVRLASGLGPEAGGDGPHGS